MKSKQKIKCHFEIKVGKSDLDGNLIESTLRDCGVHENMVLDSGLVWLLNETAITGIKVGTGNAPTIRTMTELAGVISGAYASFPFATTGGSVTADDEVGRYCEYTVTGQSTAFTADLNIAEIAAVGGTQIRTRALIKNSAGVPTAITVLSGEILVVTYRFRLYVQSESLTGVFNVVTDGVSVEHSFTSGPVLGQNLSLTKSASSFGLINVASNLLINNVSGNTFTKGTPFLTARGAAVSVTWSRAANSAALSISSISSATSNRSMPVQIVVSPPVVITTDQRATWGFTQYLEQDYS